ncbi:MAG: response regulator [Planctomycetota bacterium]|nr:MAG: response regulator [Planctomycetota bacterium]
MGWSDYNPLNRTKGKGTASNILVVDDDSEIRDMLKQLLDFAGYTITLAGNGKEALEKLEEQDFQLMVTDIVMPDADGLEVIMNARKIRPELQIIAMSGGGHGSPDNYLKLASAFGADRALLKPFTPQELLDAVQNILTHQG